MLTDEGAGLAFLLAIGRGASVRLAFSWGLTLKSDMVALQMEEFLFLEHQEFVHRYRANELRCHVNMDAAMKICDAIKDAGGCVYQGTKAVGCLLPLVGISLFFFTDWWKGLLCIILGIIVLKAIRKTAGQNVIDLAIREKKFYEQMIGADVIQVVAIKP